MDVMWTFMQLSLFVMVVVAEEETSGGKFFASDEYKSVKSSNSDSGRAWLAGDFDYANPPPPPPPPVAAASGGGGGSYNYVQQQQQQYRGGSQNSFQNLNIQQNSYQKSSQQQSQQNPYQQQQPPPPAPQQFQQGQGNQQPQVKTHQFHPSHHQPGQQDTQQQYQQVQASSSQQQQQQQRQYQGQGQRSGQHQQRLQNQHNQQQPISPPGAPHVPYSQQQQQQLPPQQEVVIEEAWKKNDETNPWLFEQPVEPKTWSPEDEKFRQHVFSNMKTKWDIDDEERAKLRKLQNTQGQVVYEKAFLTKEDLQGGPKSIQHGAVLTPGINGQQQFIQENQQRVYGQQREPAFEFRPKDYYKGGVPEDPNTKIILADYERRKLERLQAEKEAAAAAAAAALAPVGAGRSRSHRLDDPPGEIMPEGRWFDDEEMDYIYGKGSSHSKSFGNVKILCIYTIITVYFANFYFA